MAKPKQIYVCSECGAEYNQWFGLCKECNEFGTIAEEPVDANNKGFSRGGWQIPIARKVARFRENPEFR